MNPSPQTAAGASGLPRALSRVLAAVCTSAAAGAGIWMAGEGTPPLQRVGLAAFLSLVVFEDVRRMRIPNALTFPALAGALALAAIEGGFEAVGPALLGAAAGLALLLIPYALGWLGAGDVKAMSVLGALLGLGSLLPLLYYAILAGGVLALAFVTIRGELGALLVRWGLSLQTTLITRRWTWFAPAPGSACAAGLPFGVAMACGAIALSLLGAPR